MSYHPASDEVHVEWSIVSGTPDRFDRVVRLDDQIATMRDGVRLGADVYLPAAAGPLPAVAIRQPYGKRTEDMSMDVVGSFFARKGYACVVQDVRGKFSSEGSFDPGVAEVEDGYDTVEWIAASEWCDGRVGLWGESYYGYTSLAAAISGHPAIACIAPGDIGADRRAAWFRQGAFLQNTTGYWAMAMDDQEYADVTTVDPWHLPLAGMAATAGLDGAYFREILDRVEDDDWWGRRGLLGRLAGVRVPILSWGGWWDNYLGPQLRDHVTIRDAHPDPATVHLMIGPWDHEGSGDYTDRAVCIQLPPTSQHRWDAYQAFFDHYLMGIDNGFGSEGPVELFTLGPNSWRHEPAWPPPASEPTPMYLRAGGRLSRVVSDGDEEPDPYRYDPADPVADTVGENCWALCTALGDRRRLDGRADILRYTGDVLEDDLGLSGPVTAVLHASSSAVDTDFTVTLCDVFADGTVNPIADGIVRGRYRHGLSAPEPIEPGRPHEYRIDLFATSYVVAAGHRLRVDVSSSCFDRFDRNPNTGEPFGRAAATVVAEQAVHHSAALPSHVVLPVLRRG